MPGWTDKDLARRNQDLGMDLADASPKPKRVNPWAPYRSTTELCYASYLSSLQGLSIVYQWEYEPQKWRLANRCYFT